jgi:SOS response regulatory protein OraA/RecX
MVELEGSQNKQLAEHIKKNLKKGYTTDSLKYSLMSQGYSRTTVEKAIETVNKQLALEAPKMQEKPEIKVTMINDEEMKQRIMNQDEINRGFFSKILRKIFG